MSSSLGGMTPESKSSFKQSLIDQKIADDLLKAHRKAKRDLKKLGGSSSSSSSLAAANMVDASLLPVAGPTDQDNNDAPSSPPPMSQAPSITVVTVNDMPLADTHHFHPHTPIVVSPAATHDDATPNTPSTPINQQMTPSSLSTPVTPIMKDYEKSVNQVHHYDDDVEMRDAPALIESNDLAQPITVPLSNVPSNTLIAPAAVSKPYIASCTTHGTILHLWLLYLQDMHCTPLQVSSLVDELWHDAEVTSPLFQSLVARVKSMNCNLHMESNGVASWIACTRFYSDLIQRVKNDFTTFVHQLPSLAGDANASFDAIHKIACNLAHFFQYLSAELEVAAVYRAQNPQFANEALWSPRTILWRERTIHLVPRTTF